MEKIEKALDKLDVYIDICEEELVIDTTKNNRKLLADARAELAELRENLRGIIDEYKKWHYCGGCDMCNKVDELARMIGGD